MFNTSRLMCHSLFMRSQKQNHRLTMQLSNDDACADIPKQFKLTREDPPDPMLAFSETLVREAEADDDDDDDSAKANSRETPAAKRQRLLAEAAVDRAEYAALGTVEKRVDATPVIDKVSHLLGFRLPVAVNRCIVIKLFADRINCV